MESGMVWRKWGGQIIHLFTIQYLQDTQGNYQIGNVMGFLFTLLVISCGFCCLGVLGCFVCGLWWVFSILQIELWSSATEFSRSQQLYLSSKKVLDIHGNPQIQYLLNTTAYLRSPAQQSLCCWLLEGSKLSQGITMPFSHTPRLFLHPSGHLL